MADAVVASCTGAVIDRLEKLLWNPFAKHAKYVTELRENQEVLRQKASDLANKKDDIIARIERFKLEKTPTKACDAWRQKVAEMENKVETIKEELSVNTRIWGACPNIFARSKLGGRVVSMIDEISNLINTNFELGFLVDSQPAKVEKRPDLGSKLAKSAYDTKDLVLGTIMDQMTPKIGIWGMGGVGKTTVLELINNSPQVTSFDFVIWVTVSKSWSIRKLQNEVAKRVSITISKGESNERVAGKLFRSLQDKKYLLLLDDVWDEVDLSVLGFPDPDGGNGCKVVLTTRKKEVCRKMGTDVEVNVAGLPQEEAYEMFCSAVGRRVTELPNIENLARAIVRECDGLPLALKVVSSALRKEENVMIWRNFLRELRSPGTSFNEDVEQNVFKVLKVSYDQLKNMQEKKCLLFCGLYPEDYEISKTELIGYWKSEGIISNELTFEEAQGKGEAILQALIDASLLEKCKRDAHVKMHDVVRDLVLALTSPKGKEPQHLVRAGNSFEKIPDVMEWKKAKRISFINRDLRILPESPDCPELLTLLLQGNGNLEVIPETFFHNMPNLRVLDLSRTGIKSLPTSMYKLHSLRELDISDCHSLAAFPPGLIDKLSQIEGIKLSSTGLSDESIKIVTKELGKLNSISSLDINFRRAANL